MVLTAVYEEVPESEGGGYVASTEELPGAISEGDTLANRELTGKPRRGQNVTREKIIVPVA